MNFSSQKHNLSEILPQFVSYVTGLERYDKNGDISLELSTQAIQDAMHARNPEKYGDFIKKLNKQSLLLRIMNVPQREKRLKLFQYTYYAMRLLDDICDDDLQQFLEQDIKRDIIYNAAGKTHKEGIYGLYEILVDEIKTLSEELGVKDEMDYCIDQIAKSLMFDFDRSTDDDKQRSKEDLEENFDMMDIRGTEYGTAVILGLNPEVALQRLTELGVASRIGYNIRDLIDDVYKKFINIPIEELELYNITSEDLEKLQSMWKPGEVHDMKTLDAMEIPDSIFLWLEKEVQRMNLLVEEFRVKYSVSGILIRSQSIPALYKQNNIREKFNNLVIRLLVIPSVYLSDIEESQGEESRKTLLEIGKEKISIDIPS